MVRYRVIVTYMLTYVIIGGARFKVRSSYGNMVMLGIGLRIENRAESQKGQIYWALINHLQSTSEPQVTD